MRYQQIAVTSLGNILEWLDFGLFLFLAPSIGEVFFPSSHAALSQLAAFSVFAAGFLCRPIGGILFGHFGDTVGRALPLRFSILIITISTLLIGLLPSYKTIGLLSPICFTLLRLIQGIAIGGEYSGVMTYLVESAPEKRKGLIGSFAATGANLGFLLATMFILLLEHYFNHAAIVERAWRVPFIIIGLLGALIAYYRIQLLETPIYENVKKTKKIVSQPLWKALRTTPKTLLIVFSLNAMSSGFYYVFFGYMPEYMQTYLHRSSQQAFYSELLALIGMLCLVPVMGILGDHYGRKKMLLIVSISMIILSLPLFYLLQLNTALLIYIVIAMATLLSSIDQGNTLTTIVESCGANIRYSSIAFAYNLSSAIFGGLSPLIVMVLINKLGILAPSSYTILTAGIGLMAIIALPKKRIYHKGQ